MRLLIDMNMSPDLCSRFQAVGREAVHWSALGAPNAPDQTIMAYAL
jgi:predicted nuclease of predicted toxin-antitoxin system